MNPERNLHSPGAGDVSPGGDVRDALRASEARFRAVVENSWEGVSFIAADGTLLYTSPTVFRALGFTPPELAGRGAFERMHPEDLPQVLEQFAQLVKSPGATSTATYRRQHKNGSWRWIESIGTNLLHDPDVQAVVVNHRDITERNEAEHARRESEDRFNAFMNNCPLVAFMKDPDGRYVYANPAFERITQLQRSVWEGKTDQELFPEVTARALRADDVAVLASGQPAALEELVPRPEGLGHFISFKFPLRDAAGRQFLGCMALDITERKRLEEQLRQAQKMEAVGRLAGGIAHDFNNLLTGILGYGEIVQAELGADHPSHAYVCEMQKAAERAALLTSQLLAFSRKQVLTPQVLDLNAVLADVEPMLRRLIGEDVELLVLPEPGLGRVRADPGQLQQVLINLAVNARDAMPRGGTLLLRTANVTLAGSAAARPGDVAAGPYVQLTVSDTGTGMTPEVRSHLFEPFFTTKEMGKGTGLGLCTSYGIIKQSGGAIEVDSAPGAGTTFRIYLARVHEATTAATAPDSRAPRGTETILLVEDEDIVRALVLKVLKQQGYKVLPASQGEDALRLAGEHVGPIHLLVADVVMPGMSGREVAELLQALRPGLRVLYLSGYTNDAVLRHGVREAETAFLQKPFTPDALARKVREVIDN